MKKTNNATLCCTPLENGKSNEALESLSTSTRQHSSRFKNKIKYFFSTGCGKLISSIVLIFLTICIFIISYMRIQQPLNVETKPDEIATPVTTTDLSIIPEATAIISDSTEDYAFLEAMQQSVLELIAASPDPREASEMLTATQLDFLLPFREATFSDDTLTTLLNEYLNSLQIELSSFDEVYNKADLLWYDGYCKQMQVLQKLYISYNFMNNNSDFVNNYISPLSETSSFFSKWKIINSDLTKQFSSITYLDYVNDYRYSVTLKNATNYNYSITFYFFNYDGSDELRELLCESDDSLNDVSPLKNFVVTNRVSCGVKRVKSFECYWTINSIT